MSSKLTILNCMKGVHPHRATVDVFNLDVAALLFEAGIRPWQGRTSKSGQVGYRYKRVHNRGEDLLDTIFSLVLDSIAESES